MSEIKFKKPRRKVERKTTAGDSDEDRSDDESIKLVSLNKHLPNTIASVIVLLTDFFHLRRGYMMKS